jgi:hypothetical protein
MIGGKAGRYFGTLSHGPVAWDQDIGVPGSLTQPIESRLKGGQFWNLGVKPIRGKFQFHAGQVVRFSARAAASA